MLKDKRGKGKALKWILGIFGVFLLIGLIAGGYVYYTYFRAGPMASLIIDKGSVQYKIDGEWKDAWNKMTLNQGYSIKTLAASEARIMLSDSVMRLDENTEIKLDALSPQKISITQVIGRTWSRLLKISGISQYEVNTPNAIASVRGTGFAVIYDGKETDIKVAEGTVNVDSYQLENGAVKKIDSEAVKENNEAKITEDELDNIEMSDLIEDAWITKNKDLDEQHKALIKQTILKKYGFAIDQAKSRYGLTDEQLDELFEGWISGQYSVKQAIADGTIPEDLAKLIPPELKRS